MTILLGVAFLIFAMAAFFSNDEDAGATSLISLMVGVLILTSVAVDAIFFSNPEKEVLGEEYTAQIGKSGKSTMYLMKNGSVCIEEDGGKALTCNYQKVKRRAKTFSLHAPRWIINENNVCRRPARNADEVRRSSHGEDSAGGEAGSGYSGGGLRLLPEIRSLAPGEGHPGGMEALHQGEP